MKEEISHILSEMKEKMNIFVYLSERKKDCVYLKVYLKGKAWGRVERVRSNGESVKSRKESGKSGKEWEE
jgi:hypothetical protein